MIPPTDINNTLLTPAQVASFTRYSTRTIRRWRQAGWLHHVGLAHRPRYKLEEVVDLMNALGEMSDVRGALAK